VNFAICILADSVYVFGVVYLDTVSSYWST